MENRKTVVLQSHIDMVCEKNNDVKHDFLTDPIETEIDGEWLKAKGTTLGADNGIGVATELAILADDSIQVNPTAVRVPVFYGHSEAVNVETRAKISAADVRTLLESAPGVEVVDDHAPGGYPTPVTHASGTDPVYVGRIREDLSHPRGLNLWVVSDNIRKGAALNAVQLAELVANGG